MTVELVPASVSDKAVLRRLLQLYHYDFSEWNGDDVDEHGEFGHLYLGHYWTDPDSHPFLIRHAGRWAGFALVRTEGVNDMCEFFVMRKYRRAGITVAVALTGLALWELHNPPNPMGLNGLPDRLASPGTAIGLALLVLAWAERNRGLLLLALAYLAAVLVPITFGWSSRPPVVLSSGRLPGQRAAARRHRLRPGPAATPVTRAMTGHPANGLDDTVHQRVRLGILTIAHEARRVEFSYLCNNLELTAGNISRHLGVPASAGLITIEKGYAGKRARTWVTLTKAGQAVLAEEIAQLKLLMSQIERTDTSPD